MRTKFKILGTGLATLLAVAAIGPSAASAQIHASNAPVAVTGAQTTGMVWTTNAGTATCKVSTVSGTQSAKTSATLTVTPKIEQCTAFGFINVPVHINGCSHILNSNGTSQLECPAGKAIDFTFPGCTITYPPQHFPSGVTFTNANSTPNRHITVHKNISGVDYEECGVPRTNGTWKETVTFKSSNGEIWYSVP